MNEYIPNKCPHTITRTIRNNSVFYAIALSDSRRRGLHPHENKLVRISRIERAALHLLQIVCGRRKNHTITKAMHPTFQLTVGPLYIVLNCSLRAFSTCYIMAQRSQSVSESNVLNASLVTSCLIDAGYISLILLLTLKSYGVAPTPMLFGYMTVFDNIIAHSEIDIIKPTFLCT